MTKDGSFIDDAGLMMDHQNFIICSFNLSSLNSKDYWKQRIKTDSSIFDPNNL